MVIIDFISKLTYCFTIFARKLIVNTSMLLYSVNFLFHLVCRQVFNLQERLDRANHGINASSELSVAFELAPFLSAKL